MKISEQNMKPSQQQQQQQQQQQYDNDNEIWHNAPLLVKMHLNKN